ncbi:MAG: hypothetical protein AAF439_10375 [Pseudomonadota bacterium]
MSSDQILAKEFGALIEKFIDRKGWNREQVAGEVWAASQSDDDKQKVGEKRKGHVTQYVNGQRGRPTSPIIRKFADALDIPDEEIEALRTAERAAAAEEAAALNIPLGFLDKMAELFGEAESFQGWDAYAGFMEAKAADYKRLQAELDQLGTDQPATANRIPDIEAQLANGEIAEAEAALEHLRSTATDKALAGVRDLSRIMSLQAEAALLRQDQDEAFRLWQGAAALFDVLAPTDGARLRCSAENRFWEHALRYGGPGFRHSAALLAECLSIWTKTDHPHDWANAQDSLGTALRMLGTCTEGKAGADLLADAVAAHRAALPIYTKESMPIDWAMTQNNLGIALQDQGIRTEGEPGANLLAEAVAAYRAALEVLTREDMPTQWAMTQNNLGIALSEQGTRTEGKPGADLLADAVAAYRAALQVHTREDRPTDWAMTQNNLGIALSEQGLRTERKPGSDLMADAIAAYRAALQVHTREDRPTDWAMTQNNLGIALNNQGISTKGHLGARLLADAVAACRAALQVHTREDLPVQWSETQQNLAIGFQAMAARAEGAERDVLLSQALAAVDGALEVYDPETMSYHHTVTTRLRKSILVDISGED